MIRRFFLSILVLVFGVMLFSCGNDEGVTDSFESSEGGNGVIEFEQISQSEAKKIMDSGVSYFLLDARTQEEFDEGHIEGAILIPEYEVSARAEKELPDKDQLILVYCRSGRRSKIAAQALVDLGYTNVKEFGGIIDWPYEIVK